MKHNYYSTENQHVLSKLVEREVYACQTMIVEEMIKYEAISIDDIIDSFPDYSETVEEIQKELNIIENKIKKVMNTL